MRRRDILFLLLLGCVFYLSKLWQGDLRGDSIFYAQVAKELLASKNPLKLTFAGEPYLNKPPFMFILTALSYKIFGINTFSAKIWSSLNAVLSGLALYILARSVFDEKTAFISASVLLLTRDFIKDNVCLRMDSTLVLLMIIFLILILKKKTLSSGISLALCLYTKGLAGFIPVLVGISLAIYDRENLKTLAVSVLIGFSLFAPWLLAEYLIYGSKFTKVFILKENIGRVAGTSFTYSKGKIYYLKNLLETYWPWLPILIPSIYTLAKKGGKLQKLLVLWWIGIVAVSIMFPKPEYGRYLMPIYPAFSLAIGFFLGRFISQSRLESIRDKGITVLAASFIIINILPVKLHRESYWDLRAFKPIVDSLGKPLYLYKPSDSRVFQSVVFYLDRVPKVVKDPSVKGGVVLTEKKNEKELKDMFKLVGIGGYVLFLPSPP